MSREVVVCGIAKCSRNKVVDGVSDVAEGLRNGLCKVTRNVVLQRSLVLQTLQFSVSALCFAGIKV